MLITNIGRLVTMEEAPDREGELGIIKNAAVLVEGGRVKWVGPASEGRRTKNEGRKTRDDRRGTIDERRIDAQGCVVIPGLIDCHTHLVHAGSRADEFAMRARGAGYEEAIKVAKERLVKIPGVTLCQQK